MKRRIGILLVMVLAIVLTGVNGYAMPIHYEEGSLAVQAVIVRDLKDVLPVEVPEEEAAPEETEAEADEATEAEADADAVETEAVEDVEAEAEEAVEEDTEVYALDAVDFQLLGLAADDSYLLLADGLYLKVAPEDMAALIDQLPASAVKALPRPQDFEPMARNAKGDNVKALQETLIAMEYLNGTADGSFGGGCQKAVTAFQAAMGAPQTGAADQLTQMLLLSAQQEPISVVPYVDPAERYAAIAGKTTANLDLIAESGLRLEYDDIAGTGMISDGTTIDYEVPSASDVDQAAFTVQFGLAVSQKDDGTVAIEPAMNLSCLCVRRPIMQEVILKSGDERFTYTIETLENALAGAKSVESATVLLDAEAVEMLANAAEEGELKIRIKGKYSSYDIAADADQLESVANLGRAARGVE